MRYDRTLLLIRSLLTLIISNTLLTSCAAVADVQLPRFTPVPTLERLPSVTPPLPTATDQPPLPTLVPTLAATAVPVLARVQSGANVRSGPGTTFEIVGVVAAGKQVALLGVADDWYKVRTANDVTGWMFGGTLTLPEGAETSVPHIQPTE